MTSKKTTIAGAIGGIILIVTQILAIADGKPETVFDWQPVAVGLSMLGLSWFARDNDTTSENAGAK